MKIRKHILFILFLFQIQQSFAHQDFWMTKDFGYVKVRIKTGFHYEEIEKAWIIGHLTQQLCQDIQYKEPIFLDFNHHYTGDLGTISDYFISFDRGIIKENWNSESTKPILKQPALVIRQVSKSFDIEATLKLIDYAIFNKEYIKSNQRKIHYHENYCDWIINTIDTIATNQISVAPSSENVKKILSRRVERPEEKDKLKQNTLSYYVQNGKYIVYSTNKESTQSTLLELQNIYQFERISDHSAVVFDTDTSFYFVDYLTKPIVSKKHAIYNVEMGFEPFEIDSIDRDKLLFRYATLTKEPSLFFARDRNLLYDTREDSLAIVIEDQINNK